MRRRLLKLTCSKCGGRFKVRKYTKDGEHFRKYTCPKCKTSEVFKRERGYYG